MPIARAVAVNADRFAGSNMAARLRPRGRLADPPLAAHAPAAGRGVGDASATSTPTASRRELREPWLVAPNAPADDRHRGRHHGGRLDGRGPARRRDRPGPGAALRPAGGRADPRQHGGRHLGGAGRGRAPRCRRRCRWCSGPAASSTASGTFGHLRIFTFSVQDPAAFVDEFVRLVALLPQKGLILDVRGQRRRPHLRQRVHPADADAAADHPGAGAVQQHAAEPARSAAGTRTTRPHQIDLGAVVPLDGPGRRDRGDLLVGVPDHARGRRQRDRPALPRPGRAGHRRPVLLRDRHLRRRVPGPRDRPGARRGRQHRRRRRERVDPRPAQGAARPRRRTPRPAVRARCRGRPTCGWRSGARCGSGSSPARRSRTSACAPTRGTR